MITRLSKHPLLQPNRTWTGRRALVSPDICFTVLDVFAWSIVGATIVRTAALVVKSGGEVMIHPAFWILTFPGLFALAAAIGRGISFPVRFTLVELSIVIPIAVSLLEAGMAPMTPLSALMAVIAAGLFFGPQAGLIGMGLVLVLCLGCAWGWTHGIFPISYSASRTGPLFFDFTSTAVWTRILLSMVAMISAPLIVMHLVLRRLSEAIKLSHQSLQLLSVEQEERAKVEMEKARQTEQLVASEAKFRTLFESANDAILLMAGPLIVSCNHKTAAMFGCTLEELTGRPIHDFFPPLQPDGRDSGQKSLELIAAAAGGLDQMFEWLHQRPDGTLFHAEVTLNRVNLEGRTFLQAIVRDVSARKQAEIEHATLQSQLIQAQRMEAVGQLAGGIAHDFNNILTAMLIHLDLMRADRNVTPESRANLNDLGEAAHRATALTRQLLMFSRRQVVQKQLIDFDSILGDLLKMLRRLIGANIGIEFKGSVKSAWIHADSGMMEQVVVNLIVNARDAMSQGGRISLTTHKVEFGAGGSLGHPSRRPGGFVGLKVADTGCGMTEATLKRIFEPFFTTKEAGKGTGLGLATVYGIVAQHDGWIEVESAIGRGTTFTIYLPAAESEGDSPSATKSDEAWLQDSGGTETILVVEDDLAVRELAVAALQRLGYRVSTAANVEEAQTVWSAHGGSFDLLLTDMIMPGRLSGLDLTRLLRKQKPDLKVIIMSGHSVELSQAGVLAQEQLIYLAKPFKLHRLSGLLRQTLAGRSLSPQPA